MRSLMFSQLAAGAAGLVVAEDVQVANPNGLLEASSIADLQAKIESSGADGLVLGSGMFTWNGTGDAIWSGPYTAAAVSNLTVTFNVTDPNAKLTLAGVVSEAKPSFFAKTGPGTLEFTKGGYLGRGDGKYPWSANTFWNTYCGMTEGGWVGKVPAWNEHGDITGGTADLAFLKPEALGASVTLAEGGLRFAKEPLETVTVGVNGGWIFSGNTGVYTEGRGVKIGTNVDNNQDAVQLRHRVRVTSNWRAHWKMWNLNGADAIVADGTALVVDGVTLDLPASDVESRNFAQMTLVLANGAKVRVNGRTCTFKDVSVDGVLQPRGMYTQASWIAADSSYGVVTATGTLFFVR